MFQTKAFQKDTAGVPRLAEREKMRLDYNLKKYDFKLLLFMLILNAAGILIMESAVGTHSLRDPQVVHQIMGSFAGIAVCILLSFVDYNTIIRKAPVIYALCVVLLLGVRLYGTASGHGAVRWIQLPVVGQVQPAEFVKVGLIIFFAFFYQKIREEISAPQNILLSLVLFSLPVLLILLQPNLSTAIIMTVIYAVITFATPISFKWIAGGMAAAGGMLMALIYLFRSGLYDKIPFLHGYQANRILTFLNPSENDTSYYQQLYSIMAIGSGMLKGKGLNNNSIFSVKNGDFLAEQDNDFIFAVIGEELGFRGSLIIILIFLLIILECLIIASRAKNLSGRLLCVGTAAWIGFQTFTNIAVATGIFPNTGITLPFFSRGVSSLLSVYMGLGIVLNVSLQGKL